MVRCTFEYLERKKCAVGGSGAHFPVVNHVKLTQLSYDFSEMLYGNSFWRMTVLIRQESRDSRLAPVAGQTLAILRDIVVPSLPDEHRLHCSERTKEAESAVLL
jgi:hypothetical protein